MTVISGNRRSMQKHLYTLLSCTSSLLTVHRIQRKGQTSNAAWLVWTFTTFALCCCPWGYSQNINLHKNSHLHAVYFFLLLIFHSYSFLTSLAPKCRCAAKMLAHNTQEKPTETKINRLHTYDKSMVDGTGLCDPHTIMKMMITIIAG